MATRFTTHRTCDACNAGIPETHRHTRIERVTTHPSPHGDMCSTEIADLCDECADGMSISALLASLAVAVAVPHE